MRVLSFIFLVAFLATLGILAFLNSQEITINLFGTIVDLSFPIVAGGIYVLGMLTGWAVVGILKRSWQRVAEHDRR